MSAARAIAPLGAPLVLEHRGGDHWLRKPDGAVLMELNRLSSSHAAELMRLRDGEALELVWAGLVYFYARGRIVSAAAIRKRVVLDAPRAKGAK